MSSIRLLMALAAQQDMHIRHLDITTAYLNGDIKEELFMEPPQLLEDALRSILTDRFCDKITKRKASVMLEELQIGNKVCLLKKALYGLRQAGRSWYTKLDESLRKLGAEPTKSDPCVYRLKELVGFSYILIYVDDIVVISKEIKRSEEIKSKLARDFDLKDSGDIKYCLGMEFSRGNGGIFISQRGCIKDILRRFGMEDSKTVCTPMDINTKLNKPNHEADEEVQKLPYRELVGSLMYLAVSTRPDIAHVVSYLSQFNENYDKEHWTAAKRVLKYLKGTIDKGIEFERSSTPLAGFVDSDWGNCLMDRRSYTGYIFLLSGGPISWDSKKQRTVALSSTEAEYMALTEATKEAIYLNEFLIELGFEQLTDGVLFNDNIGAKKLAENSTYHARSKHIDIRHHFVREALRDHKIVIRHLPTEEMPADMMTKALPKGKHLKCLGLCGLKESCVD